jgi:hypothetical protein
MKLIYLQIFLLSIGTVFSQVDCSKYPNHYIPKNLNDALDYMDCVWKDKEDFKNKGEKDAVTDAHFAGGQWIRNDWELWIGKNSLYKQFKSFGVTFPEDISSIILTSFHRRLNHKDIDFDGQIKEYKEYKRRDEAVRMERNKLAQELKIGDTVNVVFSRNATNDGYYLSQMAYTAPLERSTNCFVKGKVTAKKKVKGSYNLRIEVTSTTNCDNSNFEGKLMIRGQIFSYNMTYFNLTAVKKK